MKTTNEILFDELSSEYNYDIISEDAIEIEDDGGLDNLGI